MGISWGRREGPDHQRHGGRRRHLPVGSGQCRQARLRGGPAALHRGDQRDRPGRVRGRRDRGRGDGLPRRGRRPLVQLADPRRARRALRVRRADALDRVHGDARGRLRRRAVRRPARAGRRRPRRAQPHRQLDQLARAALQRRRPSARSASTPRCAGPGAARSRSSPATTSSARKRLRCSATACARSRSRPGSAASAPATSPPRPPASGSSRRRASALQRPRASAPVYDPGAPCTIAVELATPDHADHVPQPRRRDPDGSAQRREPRAETWWDAWRALYL